MVLAVGTRLGDFTTGSRAIFQNPALTLVHLNVGAFDARKHGGLPLVADAQRGLSELSASLGSWRAPAEWMKSGKEHRIPLSDEALMVIDRQRKAKQGDYVFPGLKPDRPLSNMALLVLLRRMKRTDLTVHGFRSSFRDWASERTSYQREVAEAALAHAIPDAVEAAYRRSDLFEKRKHLMADWATFCNTMPVSPKSNVVPLTATA